MKTIFFFLIFVGTFRAMAYPEMIRHGYTSCTACHVSPSGGGITTAYGRSLSKELLSRWSYEGEEQQLHGLIKNEGVRSWIDGTRERGLNVSGNFRYIQTQLETNNFELRRSFAMQRDLEVAATWDRFSLVTSYGLIYQPNERDEVDLRRIYGLYNLNDELSVRAGRFLPTFGIMTNDHYLSIKQRLQLGQLTERDTVELNYISESWSGYLNYSVAPDAQANLNQEKAASLGFNYNIHPTARVGLNYWYGDQQDRKRDITGVNALVGFSKSFYSLTEFDYQVTQSNSGLETKSRFFYQRLGYEFVRGVHALIQLDAAQTNVTDEQTKFYAFGSGITFYPRPHFELQLLWSRPKFKSQDFSDSAFLVFHYYL